MIILSTDPFFDFRQSFATLLISILGLILMVSLCAVVIHILNGDKDAAKKAAIWFAAGAAGFILINVIKNL